MYQQDKSIKSKKIVLPGGAGLVGQNLVVRLRDLGCTHIVVLDKHCDNLAILRRLHPDITAEYADLAVPGIWEKYFEGADVVVMLQAQIGGKELEPFIRNNIVSTQVVLDVMKKNNISHLVHISSSVVNSIVKDNYSNTKQQQEQMVIDSRIPAVILRPTLMFGWFDRKHLGWLSRFMKRVPVFPIPGDGRFMRQPMFVGDFCEIIISCIQNRVEGQIYNISGLENIYYIDIIKKIRDCTGSRSIILNIPYVLFHLLLRIWAALDPNPSFTAAQLEALTAGDEFEVIDWPMIFNVTPTPFDIAVEETFCHPVYSKIALKF